MPPGSALAWEDAAGGLTSPEVHNKKLLWEGENSLT